MTKKKTSIEKLETRNESVKDTSTAVIATRWKWREVQKKVRELWGLIDFSCGFCALSELRKGEKAGRCGWCPVNTKCSEIQKTASNLGAGLDMMIDGLFEYLSTLKVEEIDEQ